MANRISGDERLMKTPTRFRHPGAIPKKGACLTSLQSLRMPDVGSYMTSPETRPSRINAAVTQTLAGFFR